MRERRNGSSQSEVPRPASPESLLEMPIRGPLPRRAEGEMWEVGPNRLCLSGLQVSLRLSCGWVKDGRVAHRRAFQLELSCLLCISAAGALRHPDPPCKTVQLGGLCNPLVPQILPPRHSSHSRTHTHLSLFLQCCPGCPLVSFLIISTYRSCIQWLSTEHLVLETAVCWGCRSEQNTHTACALGGSLSWDGKQIWRDSPTLNINFK